jgi:hypothetical protein
MRSAGLSPMWTWAIMARAVMPANIVVASSPMISSVPAALALLGGRKAGTPLDTASTPVSAVQPEAKARSTRKTVNRPPVCATWRRP